MGYFSSTRFAAVVAIAITSFTINACSNSPAAPTAVTPPPASVPSTPATTPVVPTLVSPVNGGYVQQNDPETGCRYDPVLGHGFMVTFEWTGVRDFDTYEVQLKHMYASVPLISQRVKATRYHHLACGVVAGDDSGWEWRVRAIGADGREREWSERYFLNFTRCQLSNGLRCGSEPH
jgi:hypothetical protein